MMVKEEEGNDVHALKRLVRLISLLLCSTNERT